MTSQVIDAITRVVQYCGPILIKHTHYMISPKTYTQELSNALKDLDAAENRLQHRIDDAKNSGHGIEKDVWHWIQDVKELRETMSNLIESRHPTASFFNGLIKIPRPVERHKLSKQAVQGKMKIDGFCKREKEDMAEVSYHLHHNVGGSSAIITVFIDLDTHTRLIKKVFKVLESDDDASIIGIHGIRGVGKSTLVRTIAARARESERYGKVEIIVVSMTPDVNNLHASIVNFLTEAEVNDDENKAKKKKTNEEKLPGDQQNKGKREGDDPTKNNNTADEPGPRDDQKDNDNQAKEKKVNKGEDDHSPKIKRVLIIIDDLLEQISLSSYIESRKNLKIHFLVTSKKPELLSSINCHPILPLNALGDLEARQLLTRLVDPDKALKLDNIPNEELGKRCGGLPVFIEALAQIINRSDSTNLWEDDLNQLPRNIDSVDTILELTYKQLDDQVKILFSLCALLGGQIIQVQHLLRYSVGMGLFDKVTTMVAARNKMNQGLKSLLGSSLLLSTEDNNHITIQDGRRDFAIKCAFKSHFPNVLDGNPSSNLEIFISHGKDDIPTKRKAKKKQNSNHSHAKFVDIWEKASEGRRHVLVLRNEEEASIFISESEIRVDAPDPNDMESFFQLKILEKLKVVHLQNLSFTAGLFPLSSVEGRIIVLKDLVTLCLHNCHVKDMTGIGNLKNLQVVSFFGSTVAKLLKEVGGLKNLRSLDFRGCLRLDQIEPGALEGLTSLEELYLGRAFDKWEVDGAPHQTNASLAELNSLRRLASLDVCIPNPVVLPEHLAISVLERYSIYLGEWDSSSSQTGPLLDNYNQDVSRTLKLKLESSRVLLDGWFQAIMKRAQELHLEGLTDGKRSIHELCIGGGSGGFEDLMHLEIRNCPSTHYVVRSTKCFPRSAFTCLEFLSLDSLMNLVMIGRGLSSPKSFGKLKTVEVRSCENLKSLFCLSSIHGLRQLECIEIHDCDQLQAIIVDDRTEAEVSDGGVTLLDKTGSLTHPDEEGEYDQVSEPWYTKSLGVAFNKSPSSNSLSNKSPSSKSPTNKSPTNMFSKSPSSSKVVGDSSKTNKKSVVAAPVQQTDKVVSQDGKITMHNLRDLIIENSPNFSTFFAKVNPNEGEDEIHNLSTFLFCGDDKISFPKLESVSLRNLEKLKAIWQIAEKPVDLGNLQSLKVERCPCLLSIFYPKLLKKCLKKLEILTIDECPLIEVVFDLKHLTGGSGSKKKILPKLKKFTLKNLCNLKYIVSKKNPKGLSGFENLSSLDVVGCRELEYIFTSSMVKAIQKLEHINIEDCVKMKAIVSDEVSDEEYVGSKLEFPALKVLKIKQCPDMAGFSRQSSKLKVLLSVSSKDTTPIMMVKNLLCSGTEEMTSEVSSEGRTTITEETITFFTRKVQLPNLMELNISSAGKFTKIWHNEPTPEGSFSKLSSITVSNCQELSIAFPATILDRLEQLRDIEICECRSLSVLFELQPSNDNTKAKRSKHIVFSHLKDLTLSNLSELEHVVEKDSQFLVGFPSLTTVDVSSCDMLIDLMPVATATSLSNLEILSLKRCRKIKEVVGDSGSEKGSKKGSKENLLDDVVFPLLVSLILTDLESLVHFSSARRQLDFPSLKTLTVDKCMKMKIFSPVPTSEGFEFEDELPHQQSLFNERVGLPKLEELVIKRMKLKELWSVEPYARSFWHLKILHVEECHEVQNIIPSFMLKRLRNLESLIIISSNLVEHIVGKSDEGIIAFPKLTNLKLKMMRRLCSFSSGSKAVQLPLLNHLVVQICPFVDGIAAVKDDGVAQSTDTKDSHSNNIQIKQPLFWFYNEIAFPNLEKLKITDDAKLRIIFYGQVGVDGLSKLSDVKVIDCDTLVAMFRSNVLRTLTNLETLVIWRCKVLEVIYDFCRDGSSDENLYISAATKTAKLLKLDIYELPNLTDIWRYDPKEILNLGKLSSVEISGCRKLEYVFRTSVAKSLIQLKLLDIRKCNVLKEIVSGVEVEGVTTEDAPHHFAFPQLDTLIIEELQELVSFCSGVYTVECPLLSELNVRKCHSFYVFASYATTFQLQMELQQTTPVQTPLFLVHKDSFPHLKKLVISKCSTLRKIWQNGGNVTASPFIKLTELELSECKQLEETLFPADTVEIFRNVERLTIEECSASKVIYDMHWSVQNMYNNQDHVAVKCTTAGLKLKQLNLGGLPDLENIWNGELKGSVSFENLSSVTVDRCKSLKYLISAREVLEEITAQGTEFVGDGRVPKILFPRVTSIQLSNLPVLKSLYPRPHISRFPSLKNMDISNCTSIGKLRDDFQEKNLGGTGAGTITQSPLFCADKNTFSILKELTLTWNDKMEQELCGQFSNPELFPELQVLNLKGCDDEHFNLGSSFIHKVQIEKVKISKVRCEVLFQRGTVEEEVEKKPKGADCTKLELEDLPIMINIWEENYEHASMFKKLKSFQVSKCPKLTTLLPSTVVFSDLASLVISGCDELKTLMTLATTKKLPKLSSMKISECDKLVEILGETTNGETIKEVIFLELKYLELSSLKSLTSFCSANCILRFPLLQELVVSECHWLQRFSPAKDLQTLKLNSVQTETGSLVVAGHLNKKLQVFFEKKLECREALDLSTSPVLPKLWFELPKKLLLTKLKILIVANVDKDNTDAAVPFNKALTLSSLESLEVRNCYALTQVFEIPMHLNQMRKACFKNLQSITITRCNGLKYIFTANMASNLSVLETMHIDNCTELEEIVEPQGDGVKYGNELAIEFVKLETLRLESLPKLARFHRLGTRALKIPALKIISIQECNKMKTFTSIGDSDIPQNFFCDKVLLPSLEVLTLINVPGLNTLWHERSAKDFISQLKKVRVRKCPALKYVFSASVATNLPKLERFEIKDCDGLEEIIAMGETANAPVRFVFPKVTVLKLKRLRELKCFCPGKFHTSEWPLLKVMEMSRCPKVQTLALEYDNKRSNSEAQTHDDIHPLFLIGKDAFPRLKKMTIHSMASMKRIWHVHEVAKSDKVQFDGIMAITQSLECQDIEQVVSRPDDLISTFNQLELLALANNPSLVCFSSTNGAVLLSSLKSVVVYNCPDMTFFSEGILSTPQKMKGKIQLKGKDLDNGVDKESEIDDNEDNEDNDDDDGSDDKDVEQFHDLNAILKEKAKIFFVKEKEEGQHDADIGKDDKNEDEGESIDGNDDDSNTMDDNDDNSEADHHDDDDNNSKRG